MYVPSTMYHLPDGGVVHYRKEQLLCLLFDKISSLIIFVLIILCVYVCITRITKEFDIVLWLTCHMEFLKSQVSSMGDLAMGMPPPPVPAVFDSKRSQLLAAKHHSTRPVPTRLVQLIRSGRYVEMQDLLWDNATVRRHYEGCMGPWAFRCLQCHPDQGCVRLALSHHGFAAF